EAEQGAPARRGPPRRAPRPQADDARDPGGQERTRRLRAHRERGEGGRRLARRDGRMPGRRTEPGIAMKIGLGVTGCIGAYKAAVLLRLLQEAGANVRVVMTESAQRFVGPVTFEALSGHPVVTTMWEPSPTGEIRH